MADRSAPPDLREAAVEHPDPGGTHRAAPAWLTAPLAAGTWQERTVPAPPLDADVAVTVWSPAGAGDRVLVAHDGPEFDRRGSLGRFCAAVVAAGRVPPFRLVLVAPGERNGWYSANPAYAEAFVEHVLPAVATDTPVIGLGVSLGGLAMLHAHRTAPARFTGLFLQSGSFFLPRLDPQERGFPPFPRVVRFVARVHREPGVPVPTTLTCGAAEENLTNNRCLAASLRRHGWPATFAEIPGGHDWTTWRDGLDPHLTALLAEVWGNA